MYDYGANVTFDLLRVIRNRNSLKLAMSYYNYDNIESIDIMESNVYYEVNAIVKVFGKKFKCHFFYDRSGRVFLSDCDCRFCTPQQPCAHIGAVLIQLNNLHITALPYHFGTQIYTAEELQKIKEERLRKEEEERKRREEEERRRIEEAKRRRILSLQHKSEWLIDRSKSEFQNELQSLINLSTFSLYPEVLKTGEEEYFLQFKIGNDKKKYVVRNIESMLENFRREQTVPYGKNFAVSHTYSRFDEDSRNMIEFLKDTSKEMEEHNRRSYYYHCAPLGRGIVLDLYENSFASANFMDCFEEKVYPTFSVIKEDMKIRLYIDEFEDSYILALDANDHILLGRNGLYKLPEQEKEPFVFKKTSLKKNDVFYSFLKEIINAEDQTMYIHKNKWNEFYKYVLSSGLEYLDIQNELPEIKEVFKYEKIQLFGDVDEQNQVEVKLQYVHEDGTITPAFQSDVNLDAKAELVESVVREYAMVCGDDGKAYFDINKEDTVLFFKQGVENIQPYCEVYVSETLKKLNMAAKYTISVGVRVEHDLLKLDIDSLEIPKEELSNVLSAYHRRKRFYRLKNGDLLNLNSENLGELDAFMEQYHLSSKDLKKDEIKLDKNRMFALEENSQNAENIIINKSDAFSSLLKDFKEVRSENVEIPEEYNKILRDYQKEGYRWLNIMHQYGFNGILADDMGLGKTLQVISLLDGLQTKNTSIVVCPASLIYNWEEEVHKFSDNLKVACVVGTKAQRREVLSLYNQYDLLVTSYDYMRRDVEEYEEITFEYVILDEAQNIKNQKTKNADSVKMLKAKHRLALTGTPIENTLAELWSIFDFLMPDYLYNYHYFKINFETPIVKGMDEDKSKQLRKMVSPFILRRNKKDVLKELPDKIEIVQNIPFEEEENKLYLAYLAKANEKLQEILKMEKVDKIEILALLTRLRQLCIEPRMIYDNIDHASSKIEALLELLEQLKENKQKTLVFSAFPSVFTFVEEELRKRNISYMVLTGSTNKEERRDMVSKFQQGDVDVFMISLKAGGTGLNLTEASAVIHIDPWWNLSAQNQATDRAHRIGQEKNVQVFKLVMKNSIEERILKLQEKKKNLADQFVEKSEGSITSMNKEEIIELFKI